MKNQYPQALVLEVKKASGTVPIESATCNQWVTQFASKQKLLRDNGQVKANLAMIDYDVVVMDRDLKIVYRNSVWASGAQTQVTSLLATLK